ncbi:hypothetical protein [Mesorhizobium sp. A623]
MLYIWIVNNAYRDIGMARPLTYTNKVLIGFTDEQMQLVDDWRREQSEIPSRSEAVRTLIGEGLAAYEGPSGILPDHLPMLDRYIEEERPGLSRTEALQVIASIFLSLREDKKSGKRATKK